MLKSSGVLLFALCLSACASPGQPRAKCSGHLERINASVPEATAASKPAAPDTEAGKP